MKDSITIIKLSASVSLFGEGNQPLTKSQRVPKAGMPASLHPRIISVLPWRLEVIKTTATHRRVSRHDMFVAVDTYPRHQIHNKRPWWASSCRVVRLLPWYRKESHVRVQSRRGLNQQSWDQTFSTGLSLELSSVPRSMCQGSQYRRTDPDKVPECAEHPNSSVYHNRLQD